MESIEIIGWIAVVATIATYAMRTMLPLRVLALASNLFFLIYSALEAIYPTMVINGLLLPINLYRIYDIYRTTRLMKNVRPDEKAFEWLRSLITPVRVLDGEYLFRKGDPADRFFIMLAGEVLLEEINVTQQGEQIIGEVAFLSEDREHACSARCIGPCEIMAVDEAALMRLHSQNPAFGLYLIKLTVARLLDRAKGRTELYAQSGLPVSDPFGEFAGDRAYTNTLASQAERSSVAGSRFNTASSRRQRAPRIRHAAERANAVANTSRQASE